MKPIILILLAVWAGTLAKVRADEPMDRMWGEAQVRVGIDQTDRAEIFRDGNYGQKTRPLGGEKA